ncbi:MAG: RHS repeat-associated core domain-containing protein [Acidobacteriota bacterium]
MQCEFTGKERDGETGLDYFGARYFSAAQGRFTSPDLGNAGAESEVPQSWNMYGYALNNPGKYVDPNGESPTLATAGIGAGIGFAVGAGGELFSQWRAGGSYNWQKIGAKGAGSAVFGFGIGLTGGASLAFTGLAGVGANLAGGALERAIDGDSGTDVFDEAEIASDLLSGAIGSGVGHQISALLRAKLPLPEWAKVQLRQAKRLRRVAKGRVNIRPASAATLTQTAAGTEKFMDNLFFVWPASAARGGSKKAVKEVVKSTIRYLNPEEDKKLLEQK